MSAGPPPTTIAVEDIKEWRGEDVLGADGEKLGKLDEVYYDTHTDVPAFAAVKSGLLGKRLTLVPLSGATVGRRHLRLNLDKGQFKDAPSFDPEAELSGEDESAMYEHFGLDHGPAGAGTRRLAKH